MTSARRIRRCRLCPMVGAISPMPLGQGSSDWHDGAGPAFAMPRPSARSGSISRRRSPAPTRAAKPISTSASGRRSDAAPGPSPSSAASGASRCPRPPCRRRPMTTARASSGFSRTSCPTGRGRCRSRGFAARSVRPPRWIASPSPMPEGVWLILEGAGLKLSRAQPSARQAADDA